MTDFNALNINKKIIKGLEKEGITVPTKVQEDTILAALEGKDLVAEAVTGSGKTLAYLLPSFEKIDPSSKDLHTIILAPTHELVVQINNVIKDLAKDSDYPVRSTTIIGGVNIKRQIESLKSKPHIIVGSPGRILELIQMKKIKAHQVKTLVIDEADKLLSDNNIKTVKNVIKTTLRDRQILVYSASISQNAIDRAKSIMKDPEFYNINEEKMNLDIEHLCLVTYPRDNINTLRRLINALEPKKAIVFVNKNEMIQEVSSKLNYHGINSVCIFGNATKQYRKNALDAFKSGKANILVASDLVARGLDLSDLSHVISLDIPVDLNEYIHRAGRTGRAGRHGTAISIISENEIQYLLKIERLNNIEFEAKEVYEGKLIDRRSEEYGDYDDEDYDDFE